MPDLKNKYSDPELNPADNDFDEIVNRPDMRALNDQGDAIARDLKNAEDGTTAPEDFYEGDGKDAARRAEAKEWNAPENRFNYQKSDPNGQGRSGWSRRRKILTGAGAGGGIVGLMISLFMLLPLKIPGIMQMIANEAGQRVEQITERRAKIILGRAIISRFATNSGVVITGNGAVSTLIASMRTNNFEKKLAAKGLTIEKSGSGVRLRVNGDLIENGKTLRSDVEVYRAMENNKLTRKMVNEIVKEEIPSWRWMKRAKFAKWMRIKYGIPRYGITNSDNSDPEARVAEMQEGRMRTELTALSADIGEGVTCTLSVDCDVDTGGEGRPENIHQSGDANAVANSVNDTVEEAVEANSEVGGDAKKTLITMVLDKLGSKAIPIVGWIDLLATADHIAHAATEEDYFGKLAAYYRARQYSRHYGTWEGYGSQIQLGAMDSYFIKVLAEQTEGVENAQAFSYIQGDAGKGVPVEKIGANSESNYAKQLKELRSVLAPASNIPGVTGSVHFVLNLYYETIGGGGLLGWASEKLGGFLSSLTGALTPDKFEEWFGKLMVKVGGKLFEVLGLDFDPSIEGAAWMNATHGGATWTYNDFCQNEMGCRKLSSEKALLQNSAIAAERSEYRSQKGLAYALFSTESSTSVVSQLAVHTPSSIASLLPSISRAITNTPATLLGITTGKTSATAYVDIHGVDPYGATDEELNQPVDPKAISGEPCDETFDGKSLNLCQTDTMVAEAMLCEFEPDSEECSEDVEGTSSTGEGLEFTIASYNILHSDSWAEKSRIIGGCNQNPVPDDPNCAKTRAAMQTKIITGEIEGIPAFDVIGTQETSPEQFNTLKSMLSGYDAFPDDTSGIHNQKDGAVALFWNTEKFTKFASGKYPSISNVYRNDPNRPGIESNITQPWVGLQASNGQKVYITSVHYPVNGYGGTPDVMRQASQYAIDWVKTVAGPDATVFVVGDFNDRLSEKLSYCVMTKDGTTMHARDLLNGVEPGKECPVPNDKDVSIDHIYATPTEGMIVEKWRDVAKGLDPIITRASDHTPVYATINFPGETTGSTLNIASFNICYGIATDGGMAACARGVDYTTRLNKSVNVIKENDIDVAGLQEVRPNQYTAIQGSDMLGDTYGIFPKPYGNGAYPGQNAVIWKKDRFELVEEGSKAIAGYTVTSGSHPTANVQVQLRDKATGQEFYVINMHEPVGGSAAGQRTASAKNRMEYVKPLSEKGIPIFLTGDFNSGYGSSSPASHPYCIFTAGDLLWDAWDAEKNRTGNCPSITGSNPGIVDHIYMSKSVATSKYTTVDNISNGSDHKTVIATVVIPGAASSATSGAWAWPVAASAWNTDGQRWLESHYEGSDAWTNNLKAASDINIGSGNSDCGKPVYSMLSGTIVQNPPSYTMQVSSKINGKTVLLTYAHGNNMKKSGTVRAGQQIMTIGNNSRYGGTCHLHLEILNGDKPVCPQDVFPLMAAKQPIDLGAIRQARYVCG